ncbi:MAG: SDR family NAD(P)-dependent oxidoreductase [Pseudonocardiaceae bacterium]|nr:SDR family NAD(P)-dependent oxidoreductase [Pseudonocardiaceae bacterium]
MRPIDEQVVLVTGTTGGLGRALAERLAALGATVVMHGRHGGRLERACEQIRAAVPGAVLHPAVADLSCLAEVNGLADRVLAERPALHALVNNAGVGFGSDSSRRETSTDGIELRLAVNHVAGALLIRRLLPLLQASAPSRIVQVASLGQAPIDLADPQLERGYDGWQAYAQSKLAQVMLTRDLAGELDPETVTINALHPATFMDTGMVCEGGIAPQSSVGEGLEATLRLLADPGLDGVSGRFFDGTREARPHHTADDPAARARVRELTDDLLRRAA